MSWKMTKYEDRLLIIWFVPGMLSGAGIAFAVLLLQDRQEWPTFALVVLGVILLAVAFVGGVTGMYHHSAEAKALTPKTPPARRVLTDRDDLNSTSDAGTAAATVTGSSVAAAASAQIYSATPTATESSTEESSLARLVRRTATNERSMALILGVATGSSIASAIAAIVLP